MPAPLVFFDIAGPDMEGLAEFYAAVFGWDITPGTPFPGAGAIAPIPVLDPLPGTLRRSDADDDPQFRKVIYVGVEDVAATLAAVAAQGGAIHAPRFEVPGVVVLGLFKDPAANVIGLVEIAGGKPKIP
ncbi:MAG TPA: VOC family protein [Caulobacterales bacterium]|jgi:predicted enzyme related to lactoylglutathione lyase|nr:VOC family protein [Caulobacterales bacterium]